MEIKTAWEIVEGPNEVTAYRYKDPGEEEKGKKEGKEDEEDEEDEEGGTYRDYQAWSSDLIFYLTERCSSNETTWLISTEWSEFHRNCLVTCLQESALKKEADWKKENYLRIAF